MGVYIYLIINIYNIHVLGKGNYIEFYIIAFLLNFAVLGFNRGVVSCDVMFFPSFQHRMYIL